MEKNTQLKFAVIILSIVTGGLALINALLSWITRSGTAFNYYGASNNASYIIGSFVAGAAAIALIVLGVLMLIKALSAENIWVLSTVIAVAAASSVMFAGSVQVYMTVGLIGLVIAYIIVAKTNVKEKAKQEKVEQEKVEHEKTSSPKVKADNKKGY